MGRKHEDGQRSGVCGINSARIPQVHSKRSSQWLPFRMNLSRTHCACTGISQSPYKHSRRLRERYSRPGVQARTRLSAVEPGVTRVCNPVGGRVARGRELLPELVGRSGVELIIIRDYPSPTTSAACGPSGASSALPAESCRAGPRHWRRYSAARAPVSACRRWLCSPQHGTG